MKGRKTDSEAVARIEKITRTARFIEKEEGWFFHTREGIVLGPYGSQFDAELSASILVAQLAQAECEADNAALIRRFVNDPANATIAGVERRDLMSQPATNGRAQYKTRQSNLYKKAWKAIQRISSSPHSTP